MTVIACNSDMMAGDSQWVDENSITGHCTKIFRINGDIVGYAGSFEDGERAISWYKNQEQERPTLGDVKLLVLKPNGQILVAESGLIFREPKPHTTCFAIGSAAQGALIGMYAGATPEAAVKLCRKWIDGIDYGVKVLRRK